MALLRYIGPWLTVEQTRRAAELAAEHGVVQIVDMGRAWTRVVWDGGSVDLNAAGDEVNVDD